MDKKEITKKFWDIVNERFKKNLREDDDMKSSFRDFLIPLGLTILLAVAFFSDGIEVNFAESAFVNLVYEMFFSLLPLIIKVVFLLYKGFIETPATLYSEQGGFIENPFFVRAHAPREKESNEDRWATVDIVNVSNFFVDECFVTLDEVVDNNGNSFLDSQKRSVLWGNSLGSENRRNKIKLHPRVPAPCDIARTFVEENIVCFETHSGENYIREGQYKIKISVHGNWNGLPKSEAFDLILEFAGGNILNIREKNQLVWSNLNPKPLNKSRARGVRNINSTSQLNEPSS